MCGISGYLHFNDADHSSKTIIDMLAVQRHRGPDDQGVFAFNTQTKVHREMRTETVEAIGFPANLFLGFNRLSILDTSYDGHQPMSSTDKQVFLMLNGEIYNAFDFRSELQSKGYVFKSHTDTEVVLYLYLEYGIDGMLERLNGMFAIVIYDLHKQELLLIRDRFGIKPLYVLTENKRLSFSSEMKSFRVLPNYSLTLDRSNLDEFWLFRNLINRTLFSDVVNITPGYYWKIAADFKIEKKQYFNLNQTKGVNFSGKAEQALEASLRDAVHCQMIADVKLGCQLSGGVDSSLVTYYASEKTVAKNLETISIIPTEKAFSEEAYMDEVIQQLEIHAHKYPLSPEYYFETIEEVAIQFEQPINHPNTIGIYLLSQQAKQHVTVLLSGEGADEVLGGYRRFTDMTGFPFLNRSFWGGIKRNLGSLDQFLLPHLNNRDRLILSSVHTSIDSIKSVKSDFSLKQALKHRREIFDGLQGHRFSKQRKYEMLTYLPDLLMRQDKMSMAHSIENRVPFLDNNFVDLALSLDEKTLLETTSGKKEPKNLLKEIAARRFSKSFAYRRKQGFPIPLKNFMKAKGFQEKWHDKWRPGMEQRGIVAPECLDRWLANLDHATNDQLDIIWLATSFEIWAQEYL
jgi:asparagine synthase (glutamine-hydrolysing)